VHVATDPEHVISYLRQVPDSPPRLFLLHRTRRGYDQHISDMLRPRLAWDMTRGEQDMFYTNLIYAYIVVREHKTPLFTDTPAYCHVLCCRKLLPQKTQYR